MLLYQKREQEDENHKDNFIFCLLEKFHISNFLIKNSI